MSLSPFVGNGVLAIMVKLLNLYKSAVIKLFLPPQNPLFPPLSSTHSNTVPLKPLCAVKNFHTFSRVAIHEVLLNCPGIFFTFGISLRKIFWPLSLYIYNLSTKMQNVWTKPCYSILTCACCFAGRASSSMQLGIWY